MVEKDQVTKMLWGGRFGTGPDPEMLSLTGSLAFDITLLAEDAQATAAHAHVLAAAGLLDETEATSIERACELMVEEWRSGSLKANEDEDVHSLVERELTERLGELGRRIHAGRSRNDLVVTDLRLWSRRRAHELTAKLDRLVSTIADLAEAHASTLMPGYTHLQRAQPVSLGFHLAAHGFALVRDRRRFEAAAASADVSTLGAGALAGTTLPLDPRVASDRLGFAGVFDNAMDAVSDRDFAWDLAYAAASCGVHLSRLAEEIVLWTSSEFGFAGLSDAWSTGSSMMPQKRNPDVAELVRGRAAGGIGDLVSLLTLLKGLPLAYDRDLQEDKEVLFGTVARIESCIEAMTHLLPSLTFDVDRMSSVAGAGGSWATDLAEALVVRGMPFRDAHGLAGRVVAALEERGLDIGSADEATFLALDPQLRREDLQLGDPGAALERRRGPGGPAPERVVEQAQRLRAAVGISPGGE